MWKVTSSLVIRRNICVQAKQHGMFRKLSKDLVATASESRRSGRGRTTGCPTLHSKGIPGSVGRESSKKGKSSPNLWQELALYPKRSEKQLKFVSQQKVWSELDFEKRKLLLQCGLLYGEGRQQGLPGVPSPRTESVAAWNRIVAAGRKTSGCATETSGRQSQQPSGVWSGMKEEAWPRVRQVKGWWLPVLETGITGKEPFLKGERERNDNQVWSGLNFGCLEIF